MTSGNWGGRLICYVTSFLLFLSLLTTGCGLENTDVMSSEVIITSFYSCDILGMAQYSFPRNTTAYLNVTVSNNSDDAKNVSIHVSADDLIDQFIGFKQLDTIVTTETSISFLMDIFIPTYAFIGVATAHASIWSEGQPIYTVEDIEFYVEPIDSTNPSVRILSPENTTYTSSPSLSLTFTVDERVTWIAYCLNSTANVTLTGNTTLVGLTNNVYRLVVYARDNSGNVGVSPVVLFIVCIQHDVGVYDLASSTEVTYVGDVVNATVIVRNQGTIPETFNVTIRANDITLAIMNVTDFAPSSNMTILFHWNTTEFAKGNYSLSAYASPLSEETHLYDNYCFGSSVYLMAQPDIAVEGAHLSKTIVGQDRFVLIETNLRNKNGFVGNLNFSVYADSAPILTTLEALTGSENVTISFVWYPIDMSRDTYIIACLAAPLVFETNISDNLLEPGCVTVTINGDLTSQYGTPDDKVDMRDISALVASYGRTPRAPRWDPNEDLNDDLRVDIRDVAIACRNFGKT